MTDPASAPSKNAGIEQPPAKRRSNNKFMFPFFLLMGVGACWLLFSDWNPFWSVRDPSESCVKKTVMDDKMATSLLLAAGLNRINVTRGNTSKIIPIHERPVIVTNSTKKKVVGENLCVLIRTYEGHANVLPLLLLGWASETANYFGNKDRIKSVSLYILNTDFHNQGDQELVDVVQRATILIPPGSQIEWNFLALSQNFTPQEKLYGYDVTNLMLDIIDEDKTRKCDRYIVTNGDNLYHKNFLRTINHEIKVNGDHDIIAYKFVTHHRRENIPNTVINTGFTLGSIDLAAAVIRDKVFACPQSQSNQSAPLRYEKGRTLEWFAADFFFFKNAMERCGATTTVLPQVLLFHQ